MLNGSSRNVGPVLCTSSHQKWQRHTHAVEGRPESLGPVNLALSPPATDASTAPAAIKMETELLPAQAPSPYPLSAPAHHVPSQVLRPHHT